MIKLKEDEGFSKVKLRAGNFFTPLPCFLCGEDKKVAYWVDGMGCDVEKLDTHFSNTPICQECGDKLIESGKAKAVTWEDIYGSGQFNFGKPLD